ncbi:nucleotide exchange factor GrpE [Sphaerobacter sp.]|mgnify:FL=1|uniref:nucleotide exchange factor GrpE n=1 Tax=Sphaerobacter sp. TaxID=2099654 RepID=UPI001D786548|nr:nucleotide exchange factor GrpE [Sphaerobacter sp.]MBX5445575.1 nucleotide exchange factor GrpE [Sphaerobacter sp.]
MDERQDATPAPDETTSTGEAQAEAPPTEETSVQELQELLEQERARAAEYLEQAQRARAELINFRRRTEQEVQEIRKHAGEQLIARLLPVLDDFNRAMESVPAEHRDDPWIQGILLIERKLWSILEAEGVRPIESVGKPFDPALHEAVTVEEGVESADTVVQEFQRGYLLHDRVLRPAIVKVGQATGGDGRVPTDG